MTYDTLTKKDNYIMYTNLMIQQMQVAAIESQRLNEALRNEQLRIARQTRPSVVSQVLHTIGLALISTGERLRQEPARGTLAGPTGAPSARTA